MATLSKEKRDQLILIGMGTVMCLVVIWYLLLSSQRAGIKKQQDEIADIQQKISRASSLVKKSAELEETLARGKSKLEAIEDSMAAGDLYSWAISGVNTLKFEHPRVEIPFFTKPTTGKVKMFAEFPYRGVYFTKGGIHLTQVPPTYSMWRYEQSSASSSGRRLSAHISRVLGMVYR
ncbi:MAG: type II secretion system protein M [Verrucomicrobia bacterium]|nr:type II secretion system protein M [Verrucomicrobiota bacterium]